jgi:hypothetical protein
MDPEDLSKFDKTPEWARDWCYFYMLNSALSALTAVLTLLLLAFGFEEIYKKGRIGIVFLYLVAFIFQSVSSMVMFWMCRSSLKK